MLTDPEDLLLPGNAPVPGAPVNTDYMTLGGGVRQSLGTGKLSLEYDVHEQTDFNTPLLDTDSAQLIARYLQPFGKRWTFWPKTTSICARRSTRCTPAALRSASSTPWHRASQSPRPINT